jgi:ATP:ADP antiporter, AAA family
MIDWLLTKLAAAWRAVKIPPDKLAVALWGAAAFAALLASYSVLRPVRDALILDGNPEDLPWVFLATFTAVCVTSPVWSAVLARWSRRTVIPIAFHVFAATTVVFCLATQVAHADIARLAVGRVFYVWLSLFNLFVVSVFWSLLADLLGPANARQLYGPIAAGGTIGAIVGPLLIKLLVGTIGVPGLLLLSGLLLEVPLIAMYRLRIAVARLPHNESTAREPDAPSGGGALTGIIHVAKSPYLAAIVGYVLCTASAATFMYLAQADIVKAGLADRVARTEFFASVDLWTQVITLVLQIVIVGPAIGKFGPAVVLSVLPVAQAIGISVVTFAPSLMALAIIQVIGKSATHGLTRPARELLFTVVSRDDKYRAKHAIDTVGYRFGDLASAWLRTAVGAGAALVGVTVALVTFWLGLAAALGVGFRRRVTKELT